MSNLLLNKSTVVQQQLRKDLPNFRVGSLVAVHYKYTDGTKSRIQIFKGLVTNLHAVKFTSTPKTMNASFTVSKNSINGIKVERTFLISDPFIEKIEILESGFRRAIRSNLRNLVLKNKDYGKTGRFKNIDQEKVDKYVESLKVAEIETEKKPEKEVNITETDLELNNKEVQDVETINNKEVETQKEEA
jgi:large subunit ribosomal protein L19